MLFSHKTEAPPKITEGDFPFYVEFTLNGETYIYNVDNERFKNNIDKNRGGTAEFVSEAIENYVNHWPQHACWFCNGPRLSRNYGECGSHGLDIPEDINIVHLYKGYPQK